MADLTVAYDCYPDGLEFEVHGLQGLFPNNEPTEVTPENEEFFEIMTGVPLQDAITDNENFDLS